MSKYEPLSRFLAARPGDQLPMSFAEIERTLGFPLPRSARRHAPWWANEASGGHVQARAWLGAGWRTSRVDVAGQRIVFVRSGNEPAPPTPGMPSMTPQDSNTVRVDQLSGAARKLLDDYAAEASGDKAAAVRRALHEAAIARRGRLIDRITAAAKPAGEDSVDLIREDRDAR